MLKLSLFIFIFFSVQNIFAQSPVCNKSNISFVESAVDFRRPQLGLFKYYYQYIKKANDLETTIIVIPGGPGGSSIDLLPDSPYFDWTQILYGFASKYNAILTDPRTIGCNKTNIDFPSETFTSENVANDIISIIKSLKLDNYVIYGHSYGTVVATLIGKSASDGLIPPPKAIVMSGTLGHYFKNHKNEVLPYYYKAWGNVRSYLPLSIQELFPKRDDWSDYSENINAIMPFEIPVKTWFNFVFSNLTEGGIYTNRKLINPFLNKLLLLDKHDSDELLKLKKEVLSFALPPEDALPRLTLKPFHNSIWCKEMEEKQGPECSAQNYSFTNPFDSKYFQIDEIPIIYIQGEFDTSVPMDKAIYHYSNQLNKNKFFLVAKDGGHSTTNSISDCKELFWRSVFSKAAGIESAISSCVGIKLIIPN